MKVYFDTNVLIAAVQPDHMHHGASYEALHDIQTGRIAGYLSVQGLVEFYSVLTRTPFIQRVTPNTAEDLILQTIVPLFEVIEVTAQSHLKAIRVCARSGWKGGRVHDAVHIQAAEQAGCDRIYTYNLADFHALAPEMVPSIVNPPRRARGNA